MASTVWKGALVFGKVQLEVKLVAAARSESLSFNQLHSADLSRVKQVLFCAAEDKPIARAEIVKAYEYEKDMYVILDDADLASAKPPTAKTMEIAAFVNAKEIDYLYFDQSYYVAPADSESERPYTVLFEALQKTKTAGIAKLTMHREQVAVILAGKSGIRVHTLFYENEIRSVDEFRVTIGGGKEVGAAARLIQMMTKPFDPSQYEDSYRAKLLAIIKSKVKGTSAV
jgi:DNA end-binding protein Ku